MTNHPWELSPSREFDVVSFMENTNIDVELFSVYVVHHPSCLLITLNYKIADTDIKTGEPVDRGRRGVPKKKLSSLWTWQDDTHG